jgi:hypothetical protein
MFSYELQHLFTYTADLRLPPEVIGPIPEGVRATAYVLGGEISGPRLRGNVLPVGGDWMLLRTDGIGVVDVRLTLQTHDDALIYMTYTGLLDLGADGYNRFLAGEMPVTFPVRIAPRFQTGHKDYLWLNRLQCLGIGEADIHASKVTYDVYTAV